MTTSPVMGITDELVAELEFDLEVAETTHQLEASVSRDALAALLAERAELKRDAERWRWLREKTQSDVDGYRNGIPVLVHADEWCPEWRERLDAAIDAAMQSEAKP